MSNNNLILSEDFSNYLIKTAFLDILQYGRGDFDEIWRNALQQAKEKGIPQEKIDAVFNSLKSNNQYKTLIQGLKSDQANSLINSLMLSYDSASGNFNLNKVGGDLISMVENDPVLKPRVIDALNKSSNKNATTLEEAGFTSETVAKALSAPASSTATDKSDLAGGTSPNPASEMTGWTKYLPAIALGMGGFMLGGQNKGLSLLLGALAAGAGLYFGKDIMRGLNNLTGGAVNKLAPLNKEEQKRQKDEAFYNQGLANTVYQSQHGVVNMSDEDRNKYIAQLGGEEGYRKHLNNYLTSRMHPEYAKMWGNLDETQRREVLDSGSFSKGDVNANFYGYFGVPDENGYREMYNNLKDHQKTRFANGELDLGVYAGMDDDFRKQYVNSDNPSEVVDRYSKIQDLTNLFGQDLKNI